MQSFSWTNPYVIKILQALKNKEVSVADVVQFFKKASMLQEESKQSTTICQQLSQRIFSWERMMSCKGIWSRPFDHCSPSSKAWKGVEKVWLGAPQTHSAEQRHRVTTFTALLERHEQRPFLHHLITGDENTDEDDRPKPLPTLKEKYGCYMLNKGIHRSNCFLWNQNEKIRGCLFHYTEAIMRKVSELGSKLEYEMKDDLYKLIRLVMTLPLLPKIKLCLYGTKS
uniref:Uncharacterized protein n=1 Tax=Ditylenchus dipsaci TaxID=166011 RepID=A0A915E255_9BILA